MSYRPVQYEDFPLPAPPRWQPWLMALLMLVAVQALLLLALWPAQKPRSDLWLFCSLAPLLWLALFSGRHCWRSMTLVGRTAYYRVAAEQDEQWWAWRRKSLPVRQVWLMGPAGDAPALFEQLMRETPAPRHAQCRLLHSGSGVDSARVARQLAAQILNTPTLRERWPHLRALAWAGDTSSQQAFIDALRDAGLAVPKAQLPLAHLSHFETLVELVHRRYRHRDDWLLCAGVVASEDGEAGFAWEAGRGTNCCIQRGEYLQPALGDTPASLAEQVQRYAFLDAPPVDRLALDRTSLDTWGPVGWGGDAVLLDHHWGALGALAPFIGMSLAFVQARRSRVPCGWMCRDGEARLALGGAVPYGNA